MKNKRFSYRIPFIFDLQQICYAIKHTVSFDNRHVSLQLLCFFAVENIRLHVLHRKAYLIVFLSHYQRCLQFFYIETDPECALFRDLKSQLFDIGIQFQKYLQFTQRS